MNPAMEEAEMKGTVHKGFAIEEARTKWPVRWFRVILRRDKLNVL